MFESIRGNRGTDPSTPVLPDFGRVSFRSKIDNEYGSFFRRLGRGQSAGSAALAPVHLSIGLEEFLFVATGN